MPPAEPDPQSVFLNVPFDASYEKIFVSLVGALISLGRIPHCVLEISDTGQGRMARIIKLISKCRVSIHDLSRVGLPVRFNMPFELGIAYALHRLRRKHDFIVLERVEYRLDKTLSDLKYIDPRIHRGGHFLAIHAIYEALGSREGNPNINIPETMYRKLWANVGTIRHRRPTIFNRRSFNELVGGATELARRARIIT